MSNLELLHFDGSSDSGYCSGMTLYSPHMSVQIHVSTNTGINTQQLATSHHQTPPETSVGDFSWGGLWGRSGFMARSDRREASWQVWQCEWEAPWQLGDRATAVGWLAPVCPLSLLPTGTTPQKTCNSQLGQNQGCFHRIHLNKLTTITVSAHANLPFCESAVKIVSSHRHYFCSLWKTLLTYSFGRGGRWEKR